MHVKSMGHWDIGDELPLYIRFLRDGGRDMQLDARVRPDSAGQLSGGETTPSLQNTTILLSKSPLMRRLLVQVNSSAAPWVCAAAPVG